MSFFHLAFFAKRFTNISILRIINKSKSLQCEFHYIMNQSQFDVLYNRFDYQIENESA